MKTTCYLSLCDLFIFFVTASSDISKKVNYLAPSEGRDTFGQGRKHSAKIYAERHKSLDTQWADGKICCAERGD
jgi:hypothetical protein